MSYPSPRELKPQSAEVLLVCDELKPSMEFFVEQLGFRIETIFPADAPRVCVLSGYGLRLRLESSGQGTPACLRIECDLAPGTTRELRAPNGTLVLLVPRSMGYELPPEQQEFVHSRLSAEAWGTGRADMRYRDLIPGRQGGRFIASHIRVERGGEVPDYVHFHRVRFQMIYCAKGWARLVYEDQGQPFVLEAGDCVLQPPEIRHRVLESSAGLEVIEIGCPAEHVTSQDLELELPNARVDAEREFSAQRFLRHRASSAVWSPSSSPGFESRDFGMQAATGGLASARVLRATGAGDGSWLQHQGEFKFLYVLNGKLTLERSEQAALELLADDACVIPAQLEHRLHSASPGCELLQVCLPACP